MDAYRRKEIYCDGIFNYEYQKAGFVHRIWKNDARSPYKMKEPDMEKPKNRLEAIKFKRIAPIQSIFVTTMRELVKGKENELDEEFGRQKWHHWVRYDNSGFYYPQLDDIERLTEILGEEPPIKYVKNVQQQLSQV